VMYIMFLSHFGNKSQYCWKEHYISHVIISLTSSICTWLLELQCHHFLLACNTRQLQPGTTDAKSCLSENYHVNSKSGVNFVVALIQNCAKETPIKRDMPVVLIQ